MNKNGPARGRGPAPQRDKDTSLLSVLVDGEAMLDEEAVAFWKRFSAWMDEHRGDLAGFAESEGFASVHPEMHAGAPVLVVSRTRPQGPYKAAPKRKR